MEEFNTSELTMIAEEKFNCIISEVQKSCLNYNVQLSPFSACISLKKSLVCDKSGSPIVPHHLLNVKPFVSSNSYHETLIDKIHKQEKYLDY